MYAQKFAGGEKNFIAITGYQDEEAPGKQLADLADGVAEDKVIKINDESITVNCDVGKYGLSAHADMIEILGLVGKLRPKSIVLVHGGPGAIEKLGHEIMKEFKADVYTPQNGDEIEIEVARPRKQMVSIVYPSINAQVPLDEAHMEELWRFIYSHIGTGAALSVQDVANIWGYKDQKLEAVDELLDNSLYFEHDKKMMFLYHALDLAAIEERKKPKIMEMNRMLDMANQMFTADMGVYRVGARQDEGRVLIYFNFPEVARGRYQDMFQKFEEQTGWKVELNENVNTSAISREVLKALPSGVMPDGKISYNVIEKRVDIRIKERLSEGEMKEIKERFMENTGMELNINCPGADVEGGDNDVKVSPSAMEQNAALRLIDEEFKQSPHRPHKKSIKVKGGVRYIELSFISKAIGELYSSKIKELEDKTGWTITISASCNQMEVLNAAVELCEKRGVALKKNPSIFVDSMKVRIYPVQTQKPEVIEAMSDELKGLTGFTLVV